MFFNWLFLNPSPIDLSKRTIVIKSVDRATKMLGTDRDIILSMNKDTRTIKMGKSR